MVVLACSPHDDGADGDLDAGDEVAEARMAEVEEQTTRPSGARPATLGSPSTKTVNERRARVTNAPSSAPARPRTTCATNLDCLDGLCPGLCIDGECVPDLSALDDGIECTEDLCDSVLGILHPPRPAGTPCAHDACTSSASCDGNGACVAGPPVSCSPSSQCMVASCDPATGCTESPALAGTTCSDGSMCTTNDACDGSGGCTPGAPLRCTRSNVCMIASCDPASGCVETPIANCDPTPTKQSEQPFETRASLIGKLTAGGGAATGATFTVVDLPSNVARTDVAVTSASDGSFRIRLTAFPEAESERSPPKHVLLRIDLGGYLTAFRDAWLHPGSAIDFGTIKLHGRDSAVTNIGPDGGTARDSQNRIEVVVPAGALPSVVPIVITTIDDREEMPAPLPDATPTLFGFELEPSGTTFAAPVTVRVANYSNNAPTSIPIPVGAYDENAGRWEHVAHAPWNGTHFTFETDHFSTYDCNYGGDPLGPAPGPPPPPPPGDGDEGPCVGSSAGCSGGSLRQDFALPSYKVRNEDFALHLAYSSGTAGSRKLGVAPVNDESVAHATFGITLPRFRLEAICLPRGSQNGIGVVAQPGQPGRCTIQGGSCAFGRASPIPVRATRSLLGSTLVESFTLDNTHDEIEYGGYVNLPLGSATESVGSGIYDMRVKLEALSPESCISDGGAAFGVADPGGTPFQSSQPLGPLATYDTHVFVHHRLTSPFGAGWSLRETSRLYRRDDLAYLATGDGKTESFRPRVHGRVPVSTSYPGAVLSRDDVTGEVFFARDAGEIARLDVVTGAVTPVLSGLGFNNYVNGFAIGYAGAARKFIVSLQDRLLEIDASGAQTVLATRSASGFPNRMQAHVAARGDQVFYTTALDPVLWHVSLSDPSRTLAAMSLATGGDNALHKKATLSGVRFMDPRGITFGSDGTLYVADRRNGAVYAVRIDPSPADA